jgi:hypothetical protein
LSILGREQLPELVRFGADLRHATLRQVVADALILLVQADEEALLTLLVTGEDEESIIPLMALGRMESPAVVEECLRRMGSPNPALREACLRALRGQQSPRIRQEVLRCLKDDEASIRIEALRYLAVYRDRIDLPLLEARLLSTALKDYELDEVKAWIVSYAIVGRGEALKLLRSVLEGKLELAHSRDVVRPFCLEALVRLGTPEAQGTLDLLVRKDPTLEKDIRAIRGSLRRSA